MSSNLVTDFLGGEQEQLQRVRMKLAYTLARNAAAHPREYLVLVHGSLYTPLHYLVSDASLRETYELLREVTEELRDRLDQVGPADPEASPCPGS